MALGIRKGNEVMAIIIIALGRGHLFRSHFLRTIVFYDSIDKSFRNRKNLSIVIEILIPELSAR